MDFTQEDTPQAKLGTRRERGKARRSYFKRRWFLDALIGVSILGIAISGYFLYQVYAGYEEAEQSYEGLITTYQVPSNREDEASGAIALDFEALRKINPEILGWIQIPGTEISYPVTSGRDNVYYLNHLFDGSKSKNGSIFLDCRNQMDVSDDNSVLYGHHMKDGSMFAAIGEYNSQEFFEKHSYGYFITPDKVYRLKFIAGVLRDDAPLPLSFGSSDEKLSWISDQIKASRFKASDFAYTGSSRFMSLSTCDYRIEDGRFTLTAILEPLE